MVVNTLIAFHYYYYYYFYFFEGIIIIIVELNRLLIVLIALKNLNTAFDSTTMLHSLTTVILGYIE